MKAKVGGVWKDTSPKVKVSSLWYDVSFGWTKVNGVWRRFYTSFEELNEFTMQLEVPANGTARIVVVNGQSVVINWGDGTSTTVTNSNYNNKTYANAGVYRVTITGQLASTVLIESEWLTRVLGFGRLSVQNYQFKSARLIRVPNKLVPGIFNLQQMFSGCTIFNQDISGWDISAITNISNMFNGCQAFNQNLSRWNTAKVTNMYAVFNGASSFNQDIGLWDVGQVTAMDLMFQNATQFNQDLSKWCVSKIASRPANFDAGASAWTKPRPVWGTCPVR